MRLGGVLFLVYLGVRTFVARPTASGAGVPSPTVGTALWAAYATTFALTLTNPMTILSFAAIFAGLGVASRDYESAGFLVAGVFAGSTLWWLILSSAAGALRGRLRPENLRWVNRGAGAVIAAFGLLALVSLR